MSDNASTTTQQKKDEEPRFGVDALVANRARIFEGGGVSEHAIRGALATHRKKELTAEEAVKAVEVFLARKIKLEGPESEDE